MSHSHLNLFIFYLLHALININYYYLVSLCDINVINIVSESHISQNREHHLLRL